MSLWIAGRPASAIPKPNFGVLAKPHFVLWCFDGGQFVLWWWSDVLWGDVWDIMWLVWRYHVVWCYVIWCDVVSYHVVSCCVMWCNGMEWSGMLCDVMWCGCMMCWIGRWYAVNYGEPMSQQNPWDVHSYSWCNLGMQEQEDYGEPMSQN